MEEVESKKGAKLLHCMQNTPCLHSIFIPTFCMYFAQSITKNFIIAALIAPVRTVQRVGQRGLRLGLGELCESCDCIDSNKDKRFGGPGSAHKSLRVPLSACMQLRHLCVQAY